MLKKYVIKKIGFGLKKWGLGLKIGARLHAHLSNLHFSIFYFRNRGQKSGSQFVDLAHFMVAKISDLKKDSHHRPFLSECSGLVYDYFCATVNLACYTIKLEFHNLYDN